MIESANFRRCIGGLKDRAGWRGSTRACATARWATRAIPECWTAACSRCASTTDLGYRLCCLRDGDAVVVLCGGDKGSQPRDMERAGRLANEWRRR